MAPWGLLKSVEGSSAQLLIITVTWAPAHMEQSNWAHGAGQECCSHAGVFVPASQYLLTSTPRRVGSRGWTSATRIILTSSPCPALPLLHPWTPSYGTTTSSRTNNSTCCSLSVQSLAGFFPWDKRSPANSHNHEKTDTNDTRNLCQGQIIKNFYCHTFSSPCSNQTLQNYQKLFPQASTKERVLGW